ncbi:MAG TPA: SusC/RagA family TonB-linked outer membrane protein, partial [Pedobacter sp.]
KDFNTGVNTTPEQLIVGKVAGVTITPNGGQPGQGSTIRIRQGASLNASNDPLIVVDDVPLTGGLSGTGGTQNSGVSNPLSLINPADIETFTILKDAASTAIYGSRASNGVILITTKKGKAGKPQLSFNLNRGTTIPGSNPQLLGTDDYLMLRREAIKNDGLTVTATDLDLNGTYPANAYTNWSKELTGHSASTTRLNTTYSGGNEFTTFSIGGNYDDQGNVLQAKGYNRDGAMRLRLTNTTPNKKFSIDVSAYYTSTVNTMVPYDFTGDANILRAPNAPSYFLPDGSLNWIAGTNPYSYINVIYKSVTNNLIGSTTLNYNPIKGLNIRAVTGYNVLSGSELRETPSSVFDPAIVNRGVLTNSSSNVYNIRTWSFEPFASYVTPISKGTLTVTAGATFQDKLNNQTTVSGTGFVADARLNNPSAGTTLTQYYNQTQTRYLGYFGSISYNWANKFVVDFTSRYDGSTKFGPDHRYGLFGSVDGGYIFSQEKWVKETLPFLSFGKLKGSYGTSGGDGIPSYIYLSTYATGTAYLGNTTFLNNGLANADLHWEMTRKKDVGMTLGFLKDAITIDVDYYKNTTTQSLVLQPISSVTGFTSIGQNSPATTQSTGLEFSILTTNINRKNLRWTTNFVLTIPKTKLVAFPPGLVLSNSNYVVGSSLSNIKVYDYAGVNPATGEYNYRNAAGVQGAYLVGLTQADKVVNIDVSPKFFGSVSNSITYKSFSLDFTFSLVNKMGNNFQGLLSYLPGTINQNETTWALDRWQKPGDITNVPKATTSFISSYLGQNNFRQSSGAYERIIYSRLQNASISYNLADSFFKRINVNNMRVFVNGQNLLTFSKYHDLDPDNPALNSLPPLRVINLGVNFTL